MIMREVQVAKIPSWRPTHKGRESSSRLTDVARTSPVLRGIVEPLIYSKVTLTGTIELLRFLRSILRRPDLARYVKQLSVSGYSVDITIAHKEIFTEVEQDLQVCMASMDTGGSVNKSFWLQKLQTGDCDSLVTLISTLLPSVKLLKFLGSMSQTIPGHPSIFRSIAGKQLSRTLTELHLDGSYVLAPDLLDKMDVIGSLDHIEKISLSLRSLDIRDVTPNITAR